MCHYSNIIEIFEILNRNHIKYLVLRNYENLLESEMYLDGHGDVDLLCEDSQEVVKALGAKTDREDSGSYKGDGVHYYIYVGEERVSLDLRYVGDDYYCVQWERELLDNKIYHSGFYVMDERNYFYTLIYHAILQKTFFSEEYQTRLSIMAKDQGLNLQNYSENDFISVLEVYMKVKNYNFTYPSDYLVPARFGLVNRNLLKFNHKRWLRHYMYWSKIRVIEVLVWVKHKLQGYK